MSLIALKDIGKIYVSGNSVAVGIRGVNLSFEKGEFIAITGESGSGKSTLLNVISGMDTYEEGEMYVEGEPTSHYVQQDWEEYRQKYISFIFQDYNIIESFTVLQNVELALMHIDDKKERRKRAIDLLQRVGLEKHIYHKGSKLSGGQKQRTVIARALAKDSPVILADEPTGNLDSQTSREIIELLREVSKEKLVIIVTHSFDQVKDYATRHIRIFDGAVEADQVITLPEAEMCSEEKTTSVSTSQESSRSFRANLRDGMTLGWARFRSTPKLSLFLCVLMILSALAMMLITSLSGDAVVGLFEKPQLFTHKKGRVVIVRQDGAVLTDAELEELASKTGAVSVMHYDFLLDKTLYLQIENRHYEFAFSYNEFSNIDVGRAPTTDGEAILRVPISFRPYLGKEDFEQLTLHNVFNIVDYKIVGVEYYYDNTRMPEMVFTESGYKTAAALSYFANSLENFEVTATFEDNLEEPNVWSGSIAGTDMYVSFDMPKNAMHIDNATYREHLKNFEAGKENDGYEYTLQFVLSGYFSSFYYNQGEIASSDTGSLRKVSADLNGYNNLAEIDDALSAMMKQEELVMLVSPEVITDFMTTHYYSKSYTQASIFFASDNEANTKVENLKELGYTAVPSTTSYEDNDPEVLLSMIMLLFTAFGWVLMVVFIAIFLSLCSSRAMLATKGDIAIFRSMGIPTPVVRISIYVQTLVALIPAYLVTFITALVLFTVPATNAIFGFLHAREYLLIAAALVAINVLLSHRYVKRIFGNSVKKALKGDGEV